MLSCACKVLLVFMAVVWFYRYNVTKIIILILLITAPYIVTLLYITIIYHLWHYYTVLQYCLYVPTLYDKYHIIIICDRQRSQRCSRLIRFSSHLSSRRGNKILIKNNIYLYTLYTPGVLLSAGRSIIQSRYILLPSGIQNCNIYNMGTGGWMAKLRRIRAINNDVGRKR